MNRDARDLIFTAAILAIVGWAVWEARDWSIRARLFPWAVGFPLLVLLGLLLVLQLSRLLGWRGSKPAALAAEEEPEIDPALARRRAFGIIGWLLGFLALIWGLGFPAGGTLATLAYLKLSAGEKWPISLAISAVTAMFFALMINGLHTPFPQGTLFEMLGG